MASLSTLLQATSRTFALAIPLLDPPCQARVAVAYLLFRVADTLEDAASWPCEQRSSALARLDELLVSPSVPALEQAARDWSSSGPTKHAGYLELLRHLPELFAELQASPAGVRRTIVTHLRRTLAGMRLTLAQHTNLGRVEVHDLAALRRYCYSVAGIVGELLTELFVAHNHGLHKSRVALLEHAAAFGEGLQLVNVLKDAEADEREGRAFVPAGLERAVLVTLAREDLLRARRYVGLLERGRAAPGVIQFCKLPIMLAEATLTKLERDGAGAKLSRPELAEILTQLRAEQLPDAELSALAK